MERSERAVLGALLLVTAARLLLAAFTELSPDEAYYLLWAQRLDWSYYSKGPGIALLLKLSTSLLGETQLGIRLLSPLLGLGTSLMAWELGRRTVGRQAALWAVVAFNLTPIFNAGSIVMTIDPVLMFCWTAAMLAFWLAVQGREQGLALRWWGCAGLALGAGFLAKYTILVVFLTMVLYLLMEKAHRVEFRRPGFWIMTGCVLLSLVPVAVWNSAHGWITVRHLLERTGFLLKDSSPAQASQGFPIRIDDFFAYLGMHFAVYSPLLFAGLLATLVRICKRFRRSEEEFFLGLFSVPLIAFYLALSLGDAGEVNWTAPGFLGLGLLALRYWGELDWPAVRKARWARWALGLSLIMSVWLANPDGPRLLGLSWPYQRDPFLRLRGWQEAAAELEAFAAEMRRETGEPLFVIANRYQTAATLAFYARDLEVIRPAPAYPVVNGRIFEGGKIRNQFPFWPSYLQPARPEDAALFEGKNAIYITDDIRGRVVAPDLQPLFKRCELRRSFEVVRRGQPLRAWKIFACYGFQGSDGSQRRGT